MEPTNSMPEPNQPVTAPEPPVEEQTVREWVARNGSTLVFIAVLIGLMWNWLGLAGLGTAALVALGLGMVIFIHELGHFLVAKWCDVHVETFSIGFGPPLPGCKFQRGETTYMIALFPLGGYVKMVGEGAENEDEDNDPRSFKNKAVWQRMAIISAGVFMNLVLGIACFIFVYMAQGVERAPGVIGRVDAGSPAWKLGAMSGDVIDRIGNAVHPYFDQLLPEVALSNSGEQLPFVFGPPGQKPTDTIIEARKDENDEKPVIGVGPPNSLKLLPEKAKKVRKSAVRHDSAAARAQPPFQWGDEVIATTDPAADGKVTELKPDPRYKDKPPPDYFQFRRRSQELGGKEMKVRVRRQPEDPKASPEEVEITVPPAYHYTFGLRMKMGQITAVRDNSPAAKAGVRPQEGKTEGDVIDGVVAVYPDGKQQAWGKPDKVPAGVTPQELDPMRLPADLTAHGTPKEVKLTVLRPEGHGPKKNVELTLAWDDRFRFDNEVPISSTSPWPVPQLGLAYSVKTTVDGVRPGSPAAAARSEGGQGLRIEKDDEIIEECGYVLEKNSDTPRAQTRKRFFFFTEPNFRPIEKTGWPNFLYAFQFHDIKELDLKFKRGEQTFVVHLKAEEDKGWPAADRGLILLPELRLQKAHSMSEAVGLGFTRAFRFVGHIYKQLQALATGRLSFKLMNGPIGIAGTAYEAASMDTYTLILFLGIISVNLAVVNFLPIPILDGGHMVFLIYEGLRGKPAPEAVRIGATYIGLAVVGCLMVFVICLDLRHWW